MSVDRVAAMQMLRRSRQQGVPVIVAGDDVVVGFDRPRLEQIASRYAQAAPNGSDGLKLGLVVRDSLAGVEVGRTRPGSLGERAGVRPGDLIDSLGGQAVRSVAELERLAGAAKAGSETDLIVRREQQSVRLRVPAT